jgi:SiaC family regulatory phosphoprotein
MSYSLEKTPKTPLVKFDSGGTFELTGKSIPENSVQFYQPIYAWLDNYVLNPAPKTNLTVQLDYFNTSSSKCIADVFKKLDLISKNGQGEVTITWKYDENDEDMQEAGEDYKSIIKNVTFNITSFKKE